MTRKNILRAITIATDDYLRYTARLVNSFLKYHPSGEMLVFCEDDITANFLRSDRCRVRMLRSIRQYGVKRAKFEAYCIAMEDGGFLYLDSDIIVLDKLESLKDDSALVACPDDLSGCDFVHNRRYPWPARPDLEAVFYFNSGVFYAPALLADFFSHCYLTSLDNVKWAELTIPGKLFDNHFLCGMVNESLLPIKYADMREYNWQGLHCHDQIMVASLGGVIINEETQRPLRLMHFAGISKIDDFLLRLPMDILKIVADAVTVGPGDWLPLIRFGSQMVQQKDVDSAAEHVLIKSLVDSYKKGNFIISEQAEVPLVEGVIDLLSVAYSVKSNIVTWNGLPCGEAYFIPNEYVALRNYLRRNNIRTVLEVGGGNTSVLFHREGCRTLSIESHLGYWADFAIREGCDVVIIPFSDENGGFNRGKLHSAIYDRNLMTPDLLFIDSPVGTHNRRLALTQMLNFIRPRFIAFHDAKRDAELIFSVGAMSGYHVDYFENSYRGLVFLSREVTTLSKKLVSVGTESMDYQCLPSMAVTVEVVSEIPDTRCGVHRLLVKVINNSSILVHASGDQQMFLSYHLYRRDHELLSWDHPRYFLPCDLEQGDEVIIEVAMSRSDWDMIGGIQFDLVCEGHYWASQLDGAGDFPVFWIKTINI